MITAWTALSAAPLSRRFRNALINSRTARNQYRTVASARQKLGKTEPPMKVAVVGCVHGEIDAMYAAVSELERAQNTKVELILCTGDFQAIRNLSDLACMACPQKFRQMGSFWKYYAGSSVATVPTIFIGGNHEASNHLQEIPLGGLVAPNIYFLGNAGVINYRGLRIAGVSGVYTEHNYEKPRVERPPYPKNQIKSVYHMRKTDIDRLMRIKRPVDVFLSHDWPRGIWHHGDCDGLLTAKPFLRSEIERNTFGNPGAAAVLEHLQPRFWFSAHVHVKFPALVEHKDTGRETKFLALDKVLPRRDFIQLIDIPRNSLPIEKDVQQGEGGENCVWDDNVLQLDAEWLTILRKESGKCEDVTDKDIEETVALLKNKSMPTSVMLNNDFTKHGQDHDPNVRAEQNAPESLVLHPRSVKLMETLGLQSKSAQAGEHSYQAPHG